MNLELSRSGHPVRRRPTPIPVAPPRIPTPMPSNNNNALPGPTTKDFNVPPSPGGIASGRTQHPSMQQETSSRMGPRSYRTPSAQQHQQHRLDNEDIRTGWINPRLISKLDLDLIRRTEYVPPSERNMNSSAGVQYQHHHPSYQRQQSCSRQHDRDHHQGVPLPNVVVGGPTTAVATSRAKTSVVGPTPNTADGRPPRRPPNRHPEHAVAVVSRTANKCPPQQHQQMDPRAVTRVASKLPQPPVGSQAAPPPAKTMERGGRGKPKQTRRSSHQDPRTYQEKPNNLVGFRYNQSAACYLGSMTDGSSDGVYGVYSESKYVYAVNKLPPVNPVQASAAAAFFARAAQKLNLSSSPSHRKKRYNSEDGEASGFCGTLQRSPPPVPPALLRRIGVKEVTGVGKVKVMLRVCTPTTPPPGGGGGGPSNAGPDHSAASGGSSNSFFSLDKRKKQVTLTDPTAGGGGGVGGAPEDRRVGVAAPKMFAFDAVFSQDDSQTEVCSSALTDVIHAVINGNDGCLFCFGHAGLGKSYTMLGSPDNANTLGIIPCAISWLFKGINEQKQKTGARFSVRVSAVEICGPTNQLRDLLSGYSNDCEQSPGAYLRGPGGGASSNDDTLFGGPAHCELRVPTAEKAAHYLDAAVEGRRPVASGAGQPYVEYGDSHLLFTLHVYQYSVAGKGGVCGGRSRLHLLDLGNSDRGRNNGGIPLSGVGNVLLAIFNGQKHLPYKEHKLTQLLRECLGSLTCHAAMIVHVSPWARNYLDTLTTVQLASRIHRMRRRRIKFVSAAVGNGSGGSSGEEAARPGATGGTSSEPDPSSSDLSADTVIYVGPAADDATDGEHPPVYIPSLNSGDNRCSMSKALRGSSAEHRPSSQQTTPKHSAQKPSSSAPCDEKAPSTSHRTPTKSAATGGGSKTSSPAHVASGSPKSSPSRIPCATSKGKAEKQHGTPTGGSDEQWIDGPRISKSKVAEARHLMKEACNVKKCETWVDGPMQGDCSAGYGYMDSHKKNMIRKWVEHQAIQLQKSKYTHPKDNKTAKDAPKELTQFKLSEDDGVVKPISLKRQDIVEESVIRTGLKTPSMPSDTIPECQTFEERGRGAEANEEDDDDQPEMPPALPLIQPLSSREVSLESLDILLKERMLSNAEYNSYQTPGGSYDEHHHAECSEDGDDILEIIEVEEPLEPVPTQDCCLQVTEEDIARCMGYAENPLPEVDQENPLDHPLRILSQENLTVVSTFTDSMSVFTDLERILPRHRFERYHMQNDDYEDPDNPYPRNGNLDDMTKKKFDQLARLHELYTNRLAKANVANSETYQRQQLRPTEGGSGHHRGGGGRPLTRCESLTLTDMLYGGDTNQHDNSSICSEPAYVQRKFCDNCKVNMIARPATVQNWYTDPFLSASTQDLRPPDDDDYNSAHRFQRYSHQSKYSGEALASLRHPDGASNPNLREETAAKRLSASGEKKAPLGAASATVVGRAETATVQQVGAERGNRAALSLETGVVTAQTVKAGHKSEGYDSGHDSTPRTSKHSPAAMSRRAESGYDSVVRDSESSSVDSEPTRQRLHQQQQQQRSRGRASSNSCKHRHDKSFCSWFLNPFTCKYVDEPPETHF